MTNSDGNLSIDFLVGFTIFMMAFIWVATLVPNLFLGVSSHEIDFDAVAYRTGVIIAEDPGASTVTDPWEYQPNSAKDNIERFGLAISKETPNILSRDKINRFFDTTSFSYPDDYRTRVIFGDYPYNFNISLQEVGKNPLFVGEVKPENYGFIRREVKIKGASNATFDKTDYVKFRLNNSDSKPLIHDGNVSPQNGIHDFSIVINTSRLLNARDGNITSPVTDPNATYPNFRAAYQINPRLEWINITMEDFNEFRPDWRPNPPGIDIDVNLTKIKFTHVTAFDTGEPGKPPAIYSLAPSAGVPHLNYIYVGKSDDTITQYAEPPIDHVEDLRNITFAFPPRFFYSAEETGAIYINMSFQVSTRDPISNDWMGMQYLNTSQSRPWDYNYNTTEVTPPQLTDAVLEVAVW